MLSFRQALVRGWPVRLVLLGLAGVSALASAALGQQSPQPEKPQANSATEKKEAPLPAQIELLETRVRFETNGDSRKEVHAIVHINDELGARQFARIYFDYNRSFQQIEFPLLRITHVAGGTADILPSAVADQPNPAVVNAPAYQGVRVKSVRLLGLAPGDTLEYRIVTTTTNHPLAPDFWLDHTFDRSGVVTQELFEIDLPASLEEDAQLIPSSSAAHRSKIARIHSSPAIPSPARAPTGDGDSARVVYRWQLASKSADGNASQSSKPRSDLEVTTYNSWEDLAVAVGTHLSPGPQGASSSIMRKEIQLAHGTHGKLQEAEAIYDFISKKIRTVDLPVGSTGFRMRKPEEVLSSGYGTCEDKVGLFSALYRFTYGQFRPVLIPIGKDPQSQLPRPSVVIRILIGIQTASSELYVDPALEVAPFGVVSSDLRGRPALNGYQAPGRSPLWTHVSLALPFASFQHVNVESTVIEDGALDTNVSYSMRGDNELSLRLAFHQADRGKWPEVAQLLALADGFRGKITHVTASDPYVTEQPFRVEYEITQPKFVDWSKKPVRIPALLPQIGLPDSPDLKAGSSSPSIIELGTPLTIETHLILHLPVGTTAQAPFGSAIVRDYATFESKYTASGQTVTAKRHVSFLERSIPADRAVDYNAFVRAVQNDEAQEFTLLRDSDTASTGKPVGAPPQRPK